ncbi:cytochrome c oxidase assembly factor 5-like [Crassostrea angulata]|uniref:Cytochrome c oxidase assembly factor 5 n=1 Tax=Magallana gigas TaxID=29159 RepID=A0A8W8KU61_MAGGI|nr:cytochrome c oxidase assembly factor 5-like [Crassostrea gigas]XP_052722063.1 cytochrome c oxidase assembly factor 5-like [Crassostrea angulata]|eukprot:XP_011426252.1 PREDICTED: cytochrome c oxidase assembly factor 5-like [Crassostrea gigas]
MSSTDEAKEKEKSIFFWRNWGRKCDRVRKELYECVIVTDCCQKERKTPKECLKEKHPDVEHCQSLVYSLYRCKHGTFDRRQQFRGMSKDY